ncbi:putative rhodanese-related sulfurtransferase [Crateriforma conspicua]|uniref:tRNA uridine(34) hydroxylase n=2 Tax=Crateriforma TaxID=2714592 RepID=A0A5C6FRT2_9PLAN|nr:rhodanese-related sulfurtransferase [Crateriforma conspicua]TWU63193.1 putative rhodanese-related sulfurtransferase [Crateriforma conspicua]
MTASQPTESSASPCPPASPRSADPIVVAAMYRFVRLADFESLQAPIKDQMLRCGVKGTLLLAAEGINGTVAGDRQAIDRLLEYLRADDRLADLDVKFSFCDSAPFKRTRVRLKKEIVTMGVDQIDPARSVGTYVEPQQWNDLISDPDVVLIDTRNDYEVEIGTFDGAINPQTTSFRQLPEFVDKNLDPTVHKKVAMFCTGGIRCEKSTAYLKQRGFENVYHLRGGILKYLESVPQDDSRWNGDCFVFDQRVSVGHGLAVGQHVMCFGCGWPVSVDEQQDPRYVRGVHCPRCVDKLTEDQKRRFAERQRQLDAADGAGTPAPDIAETHGEPRTNGDDGHPSNHRDSMAAESPMIR